MTENDYTVKGEVYNVQERMGDLFTNDSEWYEYRVFLYKNGENVDMWDSLAETYNGIARQRLTKGSCKAAIEEIKEDIEVKNTDPSLWFNI